MASANEVVGKVVLRDIVQRGNEFQLELAPLSGVDYDPATAHDRQIIMNASASQAKYLQQGGTYYLVASSTPPASVGDIVQAMTLNSIAPNGVASHTPPTGSALNKPTHQGDLRFSLNGSAPSLNSKIGTTIYLILSKSLPS